MKTALITFNQNFLIKDFEYENIVINVLAGVNIKVNTILTVDPKDSQHFLNTYDYLLENHDNIIVLEGDDLSFQSNLLREEFPKINQPLKTNNGKTIAFFSKSNNFSDLFKKTYLPFIEQVYKIYNRRQDFKLYLADRSVLNQTIDKIKTQTNNTIKILTADRNGDFLVSLVYDKQSTKYNFDIAQKTLVSDLSKYIYAEYDVSLNQRLVDILTLRSCILSTAESFTGGNIARRVLSIPNSSKIFFEGITCYNSNSKINRLDVSRKTIVEKDVVSAEVAYQMCYSLLSTNNCNVALSSTGIAGPTSHNLMLPVGLCYIGIGIKDKIVVHKLNLTGDRNQIIDNASNFAIFRLIMALKDTYYI